jgi:hypothetical protein
MMMMMMTMIIQLLIINHAINDQQASKWDPALVNVWHFRKLCFALLWPLYKLYTCDFYYSVNMYSKSHAEVALSLIPHQSSKI